MNAKLKFIAALSVLAGVAGSSAIAMQTQQQKQITYFYDDEQHSNIVGGTLLYCDDSHYHWGSYSLDRDTYYFNCD